MTHLTSVPLRFQCLVVLYTMVVLFGAPLHFFTDPVCELLDFFALSESVAGTGATESHAETSDAMDGSTLPATISVARLQPMIFPLDTPSVTRLAWSPVPPIHPPIVLN